MFTIQELNVYLEKRKADFEIIKNETPILTTQDAKEYFDIDLAAPVLIVQSEQRLFLLIVSARRGKLDFKELGNRLGFTKFNLADQKIVEKETGYKTGAMPLVGIELPCIFDTRLLQFDYIYGGSGDELHTLKITPKDVRRLNSVILEIE